MIKKFEDVTSEEEAIAEEPAVEEPTKATPNAEDILAVQIDEAKKAGKEYQGKDFRDNVVEK